MWIIATLVCIIGILVWKMRALHQNNHDLQREIVSLKSAKKDALLQEVEDNLTVVKMNQKQEKLPALDFSTVPLDVLVTEYGSIE